MPLVPLHYSSNEPNQQNLLPVMDIRIQLETLKIKNHQKCFVISHHKIYSITVTMINHTLWLNMFCNCLSAPLPVSPEKTSRRNPNLESVLKLRRMTPAGPPPPGNPRLVSPGLQWDSRSKAHEIQMKSEYVTILAYVCYYAPITYSNQHNSKTTNVDC